MCFVPLYWEIYQTCAVSKWNITGSCNFDHWSFLDWPIRTMLACSYWLITLTAASDKLNLHVERHRQTWIFPIQPFSPSTCAPCKPSIRPRLGAPQSSCQPPEHSADGCALWREGSTSRPHQSPAIQTERQPRGFGGPEPLCSRCAGHAAF